MQKDLHDPDNLDGVITHLDHDWVTELNWVESSVDLVMQGVCVCVWYCVFVYLCCNK